MAAHLEEKLSELNSCFSKQETIFNAQKSHELVGDIGHICLQDIGVKDIGDIFNNTALFLAQIQYQIVSSTQGTVVKHTMYCTV